MKEKFEFALYVIKSFISSYLFIGFIFVFIAGFEIYLIANHPNISTHIFIAMYIGGWLYLYAFQTSPFHKIHKIFPNKRTVETIISTLNIKSFKYDNFMNVYYSESFAKENNINPKEMSIEELCIFLEIKNFFNDIKYNTISINTLSYRDISHYIYIMEQYYGISVNRFSDTYFEYCCNFKVKRFDFIKSIILYFYTCFSYKIKPVENDYNLFLVNEDEHFSKHFLQKGDL